MTTPPQKQKIPITRKHLIAEIAGWYGAVAILTAYTLASLSVVDAHSLVFQFLNLTGASGVIAIAAYKKVFQSIVLNTVWAIVAIVSIITILT